MSLGNRALVLLITLAVLFFGTFAAASAKRELFPDMDLPMVMVSANYEGATPQVVESQVTETLEQAVQGVEGVESVTSTSSTGSAQIMAEFDYGQEQDAVVRETQVAVDQMAGMLPDDVDPEVMSMSMDMMPAMMMAIGTSNGDEAGLVSTVENVLIPDIESVPGVRSASLSGTAEERVEIDLDDDELEDAGLSSQDVTDALEANGLVQAGGNVDEGDRTLSVTTGEEFTSLTQIEDVWVQPSQGVDESAEMPGAPPAAQPEPVQVSEIAEVTLQEEDTQTIARLDGEPSIALMVMATPDGNTVEISEGVHDVLDEQSDLLGDDVNVGVVFDQAPFINDSVSDMLEAGGYALIASIIVILAFLLSIRSTLVVAVSIPTSVLAAFVGMAGFGFTLNMLTLAAITIAIGRVVDDSIVVLENIRRHMSYGKERMAAVKDGVGEVATAVASSSLATIAVFLPLAFVGGMVGEIFMPFAVTSALALGASLLVALTITPVLCYWFLRPREVGDRSQEEIQAEQSEAEKRTPMQRLYLPIIRWITTKRRSATALTLAASVIIMGGTVAMATNAETDWLGEAEENNYFAVQELEPGTSLAAAQEEAEQVEEMLSGMAWIDTFQTNIGGDPMMGGGTGGGVDQIDYTITADPETDQIRNRDVLREEFAQMDTENEPRMDAMGGMGGSDLEVQVTADDQETLAEATGIVEDAMRDIDGAEDVTSDLSETQSSLEVHVDGEEAAEYGLNEATIGQMLSAAFNGQEVGNATLDEVRHDMVVLTDEAPETRAQLEDFELTAPTGDDLVLSDVADVEEVEQPPELTRIDGVTSTSVTAAATGTDLGAVSMEMDETLNDLDLPSGASVSIGGVSQDQTEGFAQLGLAILAAIVISYLIMVATFKSLIQPLIMLVSVPFAATGSLGLLLLTNTPLGAAALIGMLMLIGIVITNAIVLLDLINQKRRQGMEMGEAIVEGTRHRLRPIVMTAVGTMVALVPLATGIAGGGVFISGPVAIVVIGGLFTSTVGTLVLVPVLYQLVEWRRAKREAKWAARYERKRQRRAEKAAKAD
ncbi:efflux RND transporter permease subunit [Nocardiopsis sp. HNM0947]|uniref:Efflux RND transporter permease subunit n=1 Tax=Nocardiopsis coralli TaxID=2772213 RepID=A0ABR9PA93_9ACTN|nr:efflux RND transporter permease subunit [Nocardiopsis coralli]MBE3000763.1 efflux RND transporter permease subunit [Nocardiopsis coralli]